MTRAIKTPCAICGEPATKLCDFVICDVSKEPITCDTPLCKDCSVNTGGSIFACGPSKGWTDTYDYCPNHNREADVPVSWTLGRREECIWDWREKQADEIRKLGIKSIPGGKP